MKVAVVNTWNRYFFFLVVVGIATSIPMNLHSQENTQKQQEPINVQLNIAQNWTPTQEDSSVNRFVVGNVDATLNQDSNRFTLSVDESVVSDFWIGVQCEQAESTSFSPKEMPDATLSVSGGMSILAVTDGGAAEAAGIAKGDVLLKFSGKNMNTLNDLYKVIGETEDNEAELLVVRDGKLKSLTITPQRRPSENAATNTGALHKVALTTIEEAYLGELARVQIPDGYELSLKLVRGKQVDLNIKKENLTWHVDDNSIDELPKDIKPIASNLLATCKSMVTTPENNVVLQVVPTIQGNSVQLHWSESALHKAATGQAVGNDFSKTLDDIQAQLAELTKVIQQMKGEHFKKE